MYLLGFLPTQKSKFSLMFRNKPPTMAAKWITWVGRCFSKRARVWARSLLQRGHTTVSAHLPAQTHTDARGPNHSKHPPEVRVLGGEEDPLLPFPTPSLGPDHLLDRPAHQACPTRHQHAHRRPLHLHLCSFWGAEATVSIYYPTTSWSCCAKWQEVPKRRVLRTIGY